MKKEKKKEENDAFLYPINTRNHSKKRKKKNKRKKRGAKEKIECQIGFITSH